MRAVSSVYGKIHTLLYSLQAIAPDRPIADISKELASLVAVLPDVHYNVAMVLPTEGQESLHAAQWRMTVVQSVHTILSNKRQSGKADIFPVHIDPAEVGIIAGVGRIITPWVQDNVIVLEATALPRVPILLERSTAMRNRSVDELLIDALALNTNALMKPWACAIDGSDLLVGNTYALVPQGVSSVRGDDFSMAVLQDMLGVSSLIEIARPPEISSYLRHLDLFLTLGGKLDNGKELVLVGTVDNSFIDSNSSGRGLRLKEKLQKYLNDVANALAANTTVAFQVERIPLVVEYRQEKESSMQWIYSYNNCLVEVYPNPAGELVRKAYLPSYTLPPSFAGLQAEAEVAFCKHGFRPQSLQADFVNIARRKGSLHCLTKELVRLPF